MNSRPQRRRVVNHEDEDEDEDKYQDKNQDQGQGGRSQKSERDKKKFVATTEKPKTLGMIHQ